MTETTDSSKMILKEKKAGTAEFKPNNYRLLFLDIDDVLTSMRSVYAFHKYPHANEYVDSDGESNPDQLLITRRTKYKLVQNNPVLRTECFDRVAIGMLNRFCEEEDVHIVLSSTWRLGLGIDDVVLLLKTIGFDPNRVIGRTGVADGIAEEAYGRPVVRGMEVMEFMTGLRRSDEGPKKLIREGLLVPSFENYDVETLFKGLSSYIIIDDSKDFMSYQQKNFVNIGPDGILLKDLKRMKDILRDVFPSFDRSVWKDGLPSEGTHIPREDET
jgi:hypothetical protein